MEKGERWLNGVTVQHPRAKLKEEVTKDDQEKKTISEAQSKSFIYRSSFISQWMEENRPYIIGSVVAGVVGVVMIGFGVYWAILEN